MRLSVQIEFDKTLDLLTHKNNVIVGRSPACDLVIPHDAISRQHCKIEHSKGQYYITDLDSSNGVFIDGERLPPQTRRVLLPSSQLTLGSMLCELGEQMPTAADKVVSSTLSASGDVTSTIRLSRIDLNQPAPTLHLEKIKKITSRPRNPVTHIDDSDIEVVRSKKSLILLASIALALAWYFGDKI